MPFVAKFRVEILPLKAGAGFFARLVPLSRGPAIDGPTFATEAGAVRWAEGRLGLRV